MCVTSGCFRNMWQFVAPGWIKTGRKKKKMMFVMDTSWLIAGLSCQTIRVDCLGWKTMRLKLEKNEKVIPDCDRALKSLPTF